MEAPDKIYLPEEPFKDGNSEKCWNYKPIRGIEYIRTDVAIEKAENWLYLQLNEINMKDEDMENFLKAFRNYIKGE